MTLIRPPMTNFRMTVRADCIVSACGPLPLSIKALAPWSSGRGWGVGVSPPPALVVSLQNKANCPFHQPGLFIDFWAVISQTPLSVNMPWLVFCSLAFQATTPNVLSFIEDLAGSSSFILSVLSVIYLKASWDLYPPALLSFWNSGPIFPVSCMLYMFTSVFFSGTSIPNCPTKLIMSPLTSLSCNLHFHLKISLSNLENNTRKWRKWSSFSFPPSHSEVTYLLNKYWTLVVALGVKL